MSSAELVLRMAGVVMLSFVALLWLRDARDRLAGLMAALFCFGVISYLLCPPLVRDWQWGILEAPFYFGCFGAAVFFYLMSRAFFDDRFRLQAWHAGLLILMIALGAWHRLGVDIASAQIALVLHQLLSLAVTVAALVLAFLGKAGDLVEARRRFRDIFVGLSGAYILIVVSTEVLLRSRPAAPTLELVNLAVIFLASFAFALAMTQLKQTVRPTAGAGPVAPVAAPDPAEEELLRTLRQQMDTQFAYRLEGLTIARLAELVGTQEYLLRRLINGRLGHRNFNEFLNTYRIAEVCARFSEPESARLPILTIALESGFSSLGPFNRAFKDITGLTPTAYREAHSGGAGPKNSR